MRRFRSSANTKKGNEQTLLKILATQKQTKAFESGLQQMESVALRGLVQSAHASLSSLHTLNCVTATQVR